MEREITRALVLVQNIADRCAALYCNQQYLVSFRAIYSTEAELPWRLIEIQRNRRTGHSRRLMHCFFEAHTLHRFVCERVQWKRSDLALLLSSRATGGFAPTGGNIERKGAAGTEQTLPGREDDRRRLRQSLVRTQADRVIALRECRVDSATTDDRAMFRE